MSTRESVETFALAIDEALELNLDADGLQQLAVWVAARDAQVLEPFHQQWTVRSGSWIFEPHETTHRTEQDAKELLATTFASTPGARVSSRLIGPWS